MRLVTGASELVAAFREPRWVAEQPETHLRPHVEQWCQTDGLPTFTVFAVRNNLKQVFINLCMNAMEAMEGEQKGKLTVSWHASSDDRRLAINFHNTGPLITAGALPFIFDPYFTTKRNGMGLGLAISHNLIEAHRGDIRAENNPSGGATFRITLPIRVASEE